MRGVDGPEYKVGPNCCNPGCRGFADHPHHIFARSDKRLGGAFDWVEVKGAVFQNKTGICWRCHNDISGPIGGYKAAIKLHESPERGWVFWWCAVTTVSHDGSVMTSHPLAPIEPQPLTPEAFALAQSAAPEGSEACPTCGHVKRARLGSSVPRRARKSWTIKVPDDGEDGAAILDTLVDDLAMLLGVEANQTGRYYVLVPTLYYAHQNKSSFAESLKGVGG